GSRTPRVSRGFPGAHFSAVLVEDSACGRRARRDVPRRSMHQVSRLRSVRCSLHEIPGHRWPEPRPLGRADRRLVAVYAVETANAVHVALARRPKSLTTNRSTMDVAGAPTLGHRGASRRQVCTAGRQSRDPLDGIVVLVPVNRAVPRTLDLEPHLVAPDLE